MKPMKMNKNEENTYTPPLGRLLGSFLCAAALISTPGITGVEKEIRDSNILDVVEREMIFDPGVPSNAVDITVVQGIATLRGTVDNLLAKERAEQVAETVKGVRSVVNLIEVDPPVTYSNEVLRRRVKDLLFHDPATEAYEIAVTAMNGQVTLEGTVQSWKEKELCATVAKSAYGVTDLVNQIVVEYEADRRDDEIRHEVKEALKWNVLVDHGLIDVAVQDGKVTLSGTVGSAAEKRHAHSEAWVMGVHSVESGALEVRTWARDDDRRSTGFVSVSDDKIRDAVELAMSHDPRVLSFDVDTKVYAGTVTLRGVVNNLTAKLAAEQAARNTVGVLDVNNHVKVRPLEDRPAVAIENDVIETFKDDPYIQRFETTVTVHDDTVYLSGAVDSHFEKARAENLASKVAGVVDVVNNLRVEGDPYVFDPYIDGWMWFGRYDYLPNDRVALRSDERISSEIESELWWSPFVDADDIEVDVVGGVATLSGNVDSWREWSAARENAYEGGATYVRNELKVRSR